MGWTLTSLCTLALPARASAPSPPRTERHFLFKAHPAYTKMPPGLKFKATLGRAVWCQCLAWGFEGLQSPVLPARNWGASGVKGL